MVFVVHPGQMNLNLVTSCHGVVLVPVLRPSGGVVEVPEKLKVDLNSPELRGEGQGKAWEQDP